MGGAQKSKARWLSLLAAAAFLVAILLVGSPAPAESLRPIQFACGYNHTRFAPQCPSEDILRQFRAYTTCFDGPDDDNGDGISDKLAVPHWVAYQIKRYPGELGKGPGRPRKWITDECLFSQGIAPSDDSYRFSNDYKKANPDSPQLGYDRGHMCMKQHAYRLGDDADWNTHTVLNACPQRATLNQGIWLDLEKKTAAWADKFGEVWIIAGPIFNDRTPTRWLGEPGEVPVAIPDAFFKIVVGMIEGKVAVLAFIYPNRDYEKVRPYDHTPYLTTVDHIEALTGLDFLAVLDDELEREIESQKACKIWD